MRQALLSLGFDRAEGLPTGEIPFEPSLLSLCRMNQCGNYGKSYTCPPHVGPIETLIARARGFESALVFQKVYPLEDSFDFEGMTRGKEDFQARTRRVRDLCAARLPRFLLLGAGPCSLCAPCAVVRKEPCRFPGKAVASLESYGVAVSELAKRCGMRYLNGPNTVTYFGAVLLDRPGA